MVVVILTSLIIPITMILCGLYFTKACLPEPNGLFGYRTNRSMKNKDTWIFANRLMGKYWLKSGIYMFVFTIVLVVGFNVFGFSLDNGLDSVLLLVVLGQTILCCIPIYFVERALKNHFDENGNRK